MSEKENAVKPHGIELTITSTHQVIVNFDHGDIPPILLGQQDARTIASHINSAADRAKNSFDEDR